MSAFNPEREAYILRAFRSGSTAADIASIYGVQAPAITRVLRRNGIHQVASRGNRKTYSRATQAEKREIAPEPVVRDPCFLCGTRADFGCKHRRAL